MRYRPHSSASSFTCGLIALIGTIAGAGEPDALPKCLGGCSAAAPSTSTLSPSEIVSCLEKIATQPLGEASLELETLLFHSTQVVPHLNKNGGGPLKAEQTQFLKRELARTHADIQLRVIDFEGHERMRFDRSVPIGAKQHLHPEQADGFAPPEIGFTIQRVGLRHLWTRL